MLKGNIVVSKNIFRFSYDMDHIDEVFPFLIQDFIKVRSNSVDIHHILISV